MWRELISRLEPQPTFFQPVSTVAIAAVEQTLKTVFPEDLKSLLLETDGVLESYGLGVVWPLEKILQRNLALRRRERFRLPAPDTHLYFADSGIGDYFLFDRSHPASGSPVLVWNHEDDTTRHVASSFRAYLEGWLGGTFSI